MDDTTTINEDEEYDSLNVIVDDPRLNVKVLRHSSQCLPLAYFPSSVIEPGNSGAWGNRAMTEIHSELQKLIDEFFNNAQTTKSVATASQTKAKRSFTQLPHLFQRRRNRNRVYFKESHRTVRNLEIALFADRR